MPPLCATVDSMRTWGRETFGDDLQTIGTSVEGEALLGARFGSGPRHGMLLAFPTGLDGLAASAVANIVQALRSDGRGYRWSVVLCCDPDSARQNETPRRADETLEQALTELYHPARERRVDYGLGTGAATDTLPEARAILAWAPPQDTHLVVAMRTRLMGGVAMTSSQYPLTGLRERVRAAGLPWSVSLLDANYSATPYVRATWVDSIWPRFVHPRLSLGNLSPWTISDLARHLVLESDTANELWHEEFEAIRPFLSSGSSLRPWLDEFHAGLPQRVVRLALLADDERPLTEGALFETRTRVTLRYLRATAQLLRAVRWEIDRGHTVPALIGAIRPLTRRIGLCPEAQPVAPMQLQPLMTDLVLQAIPQA